MYKKTIAIENVDSIDIQIIRAMDSVPYKISTEKLSEKLAIPSRSIRYRLAKLRMNNLLIKQSIITHERKLGMREFFISIAEEPEKRDTILRIFEKNPAISWYVPSFGTFQGYTIHAISPINTPNYPMQILRLLKKKKLIRDFFSFEIIDYQEFGWNFQYFNQKGNWIWNWNDWSNNIQKKQFDEITLSYDENSSITNFDYLDIQILKMLYINELDTQKEMSQELHLSESQISRRIRSMEEKGIIRGYRTGFTPFVETQVVFCLIKLNPQQLNKIVSIFQQIPYPKTIAFQNNQTIGVGFEIPTNEIMEYLTGLHNLRPMVEYCQLQIQLSKPILNAQVSFDLFDKETSSWNKLAEEYTKTLEYLKSI